MAPTVEVYTAAAAAVTAAALLYACRPGTSAATLRATAPQKERIVVFSRFPAAGTTKTRLIPAVGEHGAAYLQRRMSERLLEQLRAWAAGATAAGKGCLIELRHYGGSRADMEGWLYPRFAADQLLMRPQPKEGGLGHKIAQSFREAFAEGATRVTVVGCDIPMLSGREVAAAFALVGGEGDVEPASAEHADMALGPAADGGYYLVTLSRAPFEGDPTLLDKLFDGERIACALCIPPATKLLLLVCGWDSIPQRVVGCWWHRVLRFCSRRAEKWVACGRSLQGAPRPCGGSSARSRCRWACAARC